VDNRANEDPIVGIIEVEGDRERGMKREWDIHLIASVLW
jgi:hypothetical protein